MIQALKFISSLCLWLILTIILLSLASLAVYAFVEMIRNLRRFHD